MTLEITREDLFSFLVKFVTFSESPLNIIYIEKTFPFMVSVMDAVRVKKHLSQSPRVTVSWRHPHNRKQMKGFHVYIGSASEGKHKEKQW